MKFILLLLLVGGLVALPFRMIKAKWADRMWQRIRLFLVIYVLVIFASGVVRLALNGGSFNWQF